MPAPRTLTKIVIGTTLVVVLGLLLADSRYGIIFGHISAYPHYLQTTVPSAFEVTPGERVVAAGVTVGEITRAEVTRRGRAHIVLGVNDDEWPIPTDSILRLRMSGTIKYTDRYVELDKGRAATEFANDASVPPRHFVVPVEYNQLFNIFNRRTRTGMQQMLDNAGPTFDAAATPLHTALPQLPAALGQADAVISDLGADQRALSTLVSSGAELTQAIAKSNPGMQALLDGAANTFGATASSSRQLSQLLGIGKQGNIDVGRVLFHLSRTLYPTGELARRLKPGLSQLDELTGPLNGTLRQVVSVEPAAVRTLTTIKRSGPRIDALLASSRTKLLPQLTSISRQGATEVGCLRPYTPDIMAALLNYAGMDDALEDPHVHVLQANVSLMPVTANMPITTTQLHQLFPDWQVMNPQPPGNGWGQPWYQPQCGSGASIDTAAGDSENNTYDPNGSKTISYPSWTPAYTPGPTTRTTPVRNWP